MCTHDFSRITFAAELSTNLVYNSIFVIDYDYIFFHIFFFKIKLSIFSRLCLTQNSDDQVNTLRYRNSTLIIKKKAVLVSDLYRPILRIFGIFGSEKNGIGASLMKIKM